jgi:Ca2+-transporting ATPase
MDWHSKKEEQVLRELNSRIEGLAEDEAARRLEKFGKNEIIRTQRLQGLKIFARQFASFLVLILIAASIISGLLGHWIDAIVIMIIVMLNSMFGFYQEYKAEKTIEQLKEMLVPKVKVMRSNKVEEIDAREVALGDILVLTEGDKVMADARIILSENLQVNEAALTGESMPVDKNARILHVGASLVERANMLYQGTETVRGNCKAVVVATGMSTELGKIAELVQKTEPDKNPLGQNLDSFARKMGVTIIVLVTIVSLIGLMLGFDKLQMFMTGVSLAVASVPAGLPAVITVTLALATQRMLKVNSLIRKLPAAETLGRATFICVDKTGTITEEKMQVKKIYVNREITGKFEKDSETELLFRIGVLCNNARFEKSANGIEEYIIGDPTEKALILAAQNYGMNKKKEAEKHARIKEFPFSSERKMMSIVRESNGNYISYAKGAPEIIIEKSGAELLNGQVYTLDAKRKQELLNDYEKMASQGLRVLGFAYKTVVGNITLERAERNLVFVGFQGMIDPPRPEVKQAIKECNEAGIKVVIITGDSALTAKAVGEEIGLQGKMITSQQLSQMSDDELKHELYETAIFARASPEDKLRIVRLLEENGEVVAVTGDGVNDAPALKKADIGIAVGRGTDVAKDASDMILVDNNFASIVKAVKEGRRVYDNIKKFVKYMLSANLDELAVITLAILLSLPLPLLPLQLLWLNFVTDSLPAMALSIEPAEPDIMKRKPSKEGILQGNIKFIAAASFIGFLTTFSVFFFFMANIDKARTMAVTAVVIYEMLLVFNCRTKSSVFKAPVNKFIIYAVLTSLALQLIVMYTGLNVMFGLIPISIFDWVFVAAICGVGFLVMDLIK